MSDTHERSRPGPTPAWAKRLDAITRLDQRWPQFAPTTGAKLPAPTVVSRDKIVPLMSN